MIYKERYINRMSFQHKLLMIAKGIQKFWPINPQQKGMFFQTVTKKVSGKAILIPGLNTLKDGNIHICHTNIV